jgi:Protein of unknown function (DUF3228)
LMSTDIYQATTEPEFAEYELIAILAHPTGQEAPMDPLTMARNFLVKKGGTKGDFSAQQFAESIWFWSQHAMSAGVMEPQPLQIKCHFCSGVIEAGQDARLVVGNRFWSHTKCLVLPEVK